MAKVKLDLHGKTPLEKVQFTRTLIARTTGNANFVTPKPALADLGAGATTLETALTSQTTADQVALQRTQDVRAANVALDSLLTQFGGYLELESGGDEEKLHSSGVETRADAAPATAIGTPQHPSVTAGDEDGELDAHCDSVPGSASYVWETCEGNDPVGGTWTHRAVTRKSSVTLAHLPTGSRQWVRVAAIGAEQSGWSQPVSKVVA